ncbi:hypothetical protein HPB48_005558 [Haemaphysalis longicornis]|uniref:Uncharacterized protein n=1 Tax=Haemaphysalis longicornis TaxID=44386 RepID=A0A9J6G765_HAELO|nr:hypothetical protein HPB48_005558 [Haemaphysalis longicornis]
MEITHEAAQAFFPQPASAPPDSVYALDLDVDETNPLESAFMMAELVRALDQVRVRSLPGKDGISMDNSSKPLQGQ